MEQGSDRERKLRIIDEALQHWRQGDCVLGEHKFVYRIDPSCPLNRESEDLSLDSSNIAEDDVLGFVVLTQTCDIVRACDDRPFVEISPLVEVDQSELCQIIRYRRPRYAYIAGLAEKNLVADLDRVMSVEKAVVANWQRIPGCRNDQEVTAFAFSLVRKRARFAFPDDFTDFARDILKRFGDKHDRQSDEGKALRSLKEIRVRAAPSWEANQVELMFRFIREKGNTDYNGRNWSELLEKWLDLVKPSGRYMNVDGDIVTFEDMNAEEYLESYPLDLDHLSLRADHPKSS